MKIVYAVWGRQCDDEWLVAMFETQEAAEFLCKVLRQSEKGKFIDYKVMIEEIYASLQEYEEEHGVLTK